MRRTFFLFRYLMAIYLWLKVKLFITVIIYRRSKINHFRRIWISFYSCCTLWELSNSRRDVSMVFTADRLTTGWSWLPTRKKPSRSFASNSVSSCCCNLVSEVCNAFKFIGQFVCSWCVCVGVQSCTAIHVRWRKSRHSQNSWLQ